MLKFASSSLFFLLITACLCAQDSLALWPIQGKNAGEGLIYKPQDYIHNEKNTDKLFIAAPEGSLVVASKTGTISSVSYGYQSSMYYSYSFDLMEYSKENIDEYDVQQRIYMSKNNKNVPPQYISLCVSISCGKGEKYHVRGLRPVRFFKTGEKIEKGEVIGKVGYSYRYVPQPSIELSHSINGQQADPMTPFGLATTFVPYKSTFDPKKKIAVKDLKEDFYAFRTALEEGYPGLYDYSSQENVHKAFDRILEKINRPMTSDEFRKLIWPMVDSLRDSHLSLEALFQENEDWSSVPVLPIRFGVQNDSLIIFQTLPNYKNLLGRCILEINGEKSASIIRTTNIPRGMGDGYITSQQDNLRLRIFDYYYVVLHGKKTGDSLLLMLDGNQKIILHYIPVKEVAGMLPALPERKRDDQSFACKMLSPQNAYVKISSFDLTATDLDSIGQFIADISKDKVENLIMDVRNNYGGAGTYEYIFSLFAEKPFKTLTSSMVTTNDTCDFLKYCSNYGDSTEILFPDYQKAEGKNGFYVLNTRMIEPNDSIHFGGNVFVLTDQQSISAATMLPALVHKYRRGVVIGRETGSCYYQMNAVKFGNVSLMHSNLEMRMPLVKVIFENQMDPRIPWGRGVIPDYPVPFTYQELFSKDDYLLNYALKLIASNFFLTTQ